MLELSEGQNIAIRQWIHDTYGRPIGLLSDEYNVFTDERMSNELEIAAGAVVQIAIKYPFWDSRFKSILRHIFEAYPIREFRRSKAMVRREDVERWYSLAANNVLGNKPDRKITLNSTITRFITSLEMIDKKTKRSVRVEIEGSAFDAMNKATKLLYGELSASNYRVPKKKGEI